MIEIKISDHKPYVWTAEDARIAREDHRIIGTLIGCLPRLPTQNIHLGLPMQLMKEEAKLLLDLGAAVIRDNSEPAPIPIGEEVKEFKDQRKDIYEGQVALLLENRKAEVRRRQDQIIEGKTVKMRRTLQQKGLPETDIEAQVDALQGRLEDDIESIKITQLQEKHSSVQISTACLRRYELPPVDWQYPTNDQERLRYRVFRDLWERGYSLTNGGKFGGDYLVYPGDPARYHSLYIARCVPHNEPHPVLDIISLGRMGSSVKKTILLCSLDEDDHVTYTSLQWTGIS